MHTRWTAWWYSCRRFYNNEACLINDDSFVDRITDSSDESSLSAHLQQYTDETCEYCVLCVCVVVSGAMDLFCNLKVGGSVAHMCLRERVTCAGEN